MKIRGKYYFVSTSEVYGLYGFFVFIPVILQYTYSPMDMSFIEYLKIIIANPINWLIFIFITILAVKFFVHEYTPKN